MNILRLPHCSRVLFGSRIYEVALIGSSALQVVYKSRRMRALR
jgi:hypothetical protein